MRSKKENSQLNIDPSQTYNTGLSSGGGQAMVMGCLAPEIFAGMGINAAPTIGTGSHKINP
jgi:poly(3-hydroxybutyrate) depolymerase